MKHLRLFKTTEEYESAELVKPNVSFIEETKILKYIPNREEIIEYHFEIPVENNRFHEIGDVDGDFSKEFDALVKFAKKYGSENEGFWEVQDDIVIEKTNILVNGMKVISLDYYSSYEFSINQIECVLSNEAVFQLKANNAYYEKELLS